MNFDISQILEQWSYESGQVVVRRFKAKDGSEKIQLRVDLGLLQMNAQGRPDGKRPFGHESLLEHYINQLEKFRGAHEGSDENFKLRGEDCAKLQQEAIQYHHRYICLFQLEDFEGVIRDAERNLEVFDFVQHYAESEEFAWSLQQFRPQLLMMRVRAKGAKALNRKNFSQAMQLIEEAMEEIKHFFREHSRHDLLEQSGEIFSLEGWLQEIQSKRPLTPREKLENDLDEAVKNEDYEKAAQVRDALRKIS
ncbi:MAG: UvrB/UvrC motif-containing protein [Verrucomicrobiota bacterium]|nr:UvrB/UvrC motif-containing protein [Verrucomicrobiota bacterium]